MASITQKIPSYTSGISQQPDELKSPGQLREAKNVFPDVTHGLMKRPGGRLLNGNMSAQTGASKWFHYYRDENEQYIGQIQFSDGQLKMWRCQEMTISGTTYPAGSEATVNAYSQAIKNYLKKTNDTTSTIVDSDLQTLTLNDYTYVVNRNQATAMGGATTTRPYEAYISLQKVAYASQYGLNLYTSTSGTATKVTTATRVNITLVKSSNNYCNSSGNIVSRADRGESGNDYRCDDTAGDSNDEFAPNVGTKIFSISDGSSQVDDGAINDASSYTIDVKDSGGNSVNRGENLYFRVATISQAVANTIAQGDTPTPDYHVTHYKSRYTSTYDLLYGGQGWEEGDNFIFWMKDARYLCKIEEVSTSYVHADLGLIRPLPTPFDAETAITAESILGDLQHAILNATKSDGSNSNWNGASTNDSGTATVQIIGNGIYLKEDAVFNIDSSAPDLLKVFTSEIDDIADLPTQCKDGYVVKVRNSEANEDDYYVKFVGENGKDGPGVWEECSKPGRKIEFSTSTMPIQIVRQSNGSFTVSTITWDNCLVGDQTTVPKPSFMSTISGEDGDTATVSRYINKMMFFRNRLVMLSDENVIMSQPGKFFNFWPKSAITYTATDVIDLSCSSEYPAIVYDGIQVNQGLVLFTKNQQFMLTTDSDVLSPQTAKINAVSSYNFNYNTNPISLGTTIAFLDNAGKYTRFFEAAGITREGEPNVIEQSKVIAKKFPNNINLIANSRENSTIFFATKGTKKIYGFRYYTVAEQRVQQAWFEWELMGDIQHMAILDDALYAVIKNSTTYVIQKFSIKSDSGTYEVTDNNLTTDDTSDDIDYNIHLDNAKSFAHTALTYVGVPDSDGNSDYTKFNHTAADYAGSGQLAVYVVSTGTDTTFNGMLTNVTTFNDGGTTKVKIPGNFKTYDIAAPMFKTDAATRSGTTITIALADHVFKVGDAVQLTFTEGGMTNGSYTIATVTTDSNDAITGFTVTDSASGTVAAQDVQILSTQTPANSIVLGYLFDMEIEFPTIYKLENQGENRWRADVQSSLVIHRAKFSFGPTGVYTTTLKRVGKPTYTETFESTQADAYYANTVGIENEQLATLPIYERNTTLNLTLKSTHPSPATLYSMAWEGDYSPKYYQRV